MWAQKRSTIVYVYMLSTQKKTIINIKKSMHSNEILIKTNNIRTLSIIFGGYKCELVSVCTHINFGTT